MTESTNIQIRAKVVTVTMPEQLCLKSVGCWILAFKSHHSRVLLLLCFPPIASPVCRPSLHSRQVVKPASPTKSRRQVATKNEGLKKIATVENAKAQEEQALTKTPCPSLPPLKKTLKKKYRMWASSNPS